MRHAGTLITTASSLVVDGVVVWLWSEAGQVRSHGKSITDQKRCGGGEDSLGSCEVMDTRNKLFGRRRFPAARLYSVRRADVVVGWLLTGEGEREAQLLCG